MKIAFLNLVDVINMDAATLIDSANCDDTACIASIKVRIIPSDDGNIIEREVKTYDKTKALELLMRHMGMFNDKFRLDIALPVVISGADELED